MLGWNWRWLLVSNRPGLLRGLLCLDSLVLERYLAHGGIVVGLSNGIYVMSGAWGNWLQVMGGQSCNRRGHVYNGG